MKANNLTIEKENGELVAYTKLGYDIAILESLEYAKEIVKFCEDKGLAKITTPVSGAFKMLVGYKIFLRKLNTEDEKIEPVFSLLDFKVREKTEQELADTKLATEIDSVLQNYRDAVTKAVENNED